MNPNMHIPERIVVQGIDPSLVENVVNFEVREFSDEINHLVQLSRNVLTDDTSKLTFEQRIERFNAWDNYVFKTHGLHHIAAELNTLTGFQRALKNLEDELYQFYIEVDEKKFSNLCNDSYAIEEDDFAQPSTSRNAITLAKSRTTAALPSPRIAATFSSSSAKANSATGMPASIQKLLHDNAGNKITLGPNGTCIAKKTLEQINWSQTSANITRKILMDIFDRETLASHTLTGKPSPAFLDCNKPQKQQLDQDKVHDIIAFVTTHLGLKEKEVRQAITTKCADENKMYRQRMEKLQTKKCTRAKNKTM